jgi:hypothetical protein
MGVWITLSACSDSSMDSIDDKPAVQTAGFSGKVSGAFEGEITGPGIVTHLAAREAVLGRRPGYYMIANDTEGKELVITFRIPEGTKPGTYQLVSEDPTEVGEDFEVRVETIEDNTPVSYRLNTEGTLTLEAFPSEADALSDTTISGTFEFETENGAGERVSVKGGFEVLA